MSNVERLYIFELLEPLSPYLLGGLVESCATAVETIVFVVAVGLRLTTVAAEEIKLVGKVVRSGTKEGTDVRRPELEVL